MGNRGSSEETYKIESDLNISQFKVKGPIGKGSLGLVSRVFHKRNKKIYAMKQMLKTRIIYYRSVTSVIQEFRLLSILEHPFIVNMKYSFQNNSNLYLVLDYMGGGDLRFHLCEEKRFSEEVVRFFIACLVLGLEYIHSNNIIHKDIKPENLVLDEEGYLKITDFGIAKVAKSENKEETLGSPGYIAPEVLFKANHGVESDYFALGVLVYELLTGRRPYDGKTSAQMKESVRSREVKLNERDVGRIWTEESADFFNKLIEIDPEKRLGKNGIEEIKNHPWLKEINWKKLMAGSLKSPFIPEAKNNFYPAYVKKGWNDKKQLRRIKLEDTHHLFEDYLFEFSSNTQWNLDSNVI